MCQMAFALKEPVEDLYEGWGWDLGDQFEDIYKAFLIANEAPEDVFPKVDISEAH